ncbi:glycine zipper 2TM domain-containing protein, partial [Erythrobacter sp. HI0028]|uniref:glycine zipper 2TM domain-containing protein n=3 Tax=unclassified Erythrobacter TaxID=2633097 RepID=UPI000A5D8695
RSIQNRSAVPAVQQAQPTYVYIQQPPQVVYVYPAQQGMVTQAAGGASRVIYRDGSAGGAQPQYAGGYQPAPNATSVYLPAGSQVVDFDHNAWIEECRARLDTYENDSERGEIIGALLGGAAGGLLGNRIAGSGNRTAGTLIGAGAGALAGMAAGDAIEDGSRRRSDSRSQCQAYLDDYMQRATANAGATQYNQPGQYMLVPVTVEVPQMSVYRDGTPAN